MTTLNSSGLAHARSLVSDGHVDKTSDWSFSADDGNALLGPDGDDWANYGSWFLGTDPTQAEKTKAYYKYPFGKGGKVYRSGIIAAKQRAAQQNDSDIADAAGSVLDKIDGKAAPVPARRAYSTLTIKSVDAEQRIIEGVASTPTVDRMGDVVEPRGATFKLPIPLLWQHNSDQPIGQVIAAKVADAGISVTAKIAKGVLPMIDDAWALIKAGLVRGLSIGFQPIEYEPLDAKEPWGALRYLSWDWLELSAVTIPANAEASIQTIKSIDRSLLDAASGAKPGSAVARLIKPPGAPGISLGKPKGTAMTTLNERIAASEAKRAANAARMLAIMEEADGEGRTLNAAESEEYDTLETETKAVDEHLKRQRAQVEVMKGTAKPVDGSGDDQAEKPKAAAPAVVWGKSSLPKGRQFTRLAMCLAAAKGNVQSAYAIAQSQRGWKDQSPELFNVLRDWHAVTRSAVASGTTTDTNYASPLVQYTNMASEFVDLLRPATIIGKLNGLRMVPFNIRFATQTSGVSVGWVGQGLPAKATKQQYITSTIGFAKIAAIIAITKELAEFSSPSAEQLVQDDLTKYTATFMDAQFIDPSVAAVANVSPASITNGITAVQANANPVTLASIEIDVSSLMGALTSANVDVSNLVWVMTPDSAFRISQIRTTNGPYAFPGIGVQGGEWLGMPVITSNSVPHSTSGGSIIVLFNPGDIFMADDNGVQIDASQEASVQMDDSPSSSASSLISLWQSGLLGIRLERVVNWQRRRDVSVTYLDNVHFVSN